MGEIELILTCGACPEQYDAKIDGRQVGYLRLRYGFFRVDCPDCGGETVYEAKPIGDGSFEPNEREFYLSAAIGAIKDWLARPTAQPEGNGE
jgi:hypothetical protein